MRAHSHTREWGYDNEIKLLFFYNIELKKEKGMRNEIEGQNVWKMDVKDIKRENSPLILVTWHFVLHMVDVLS